MSEEIKETEEIKEPTLEEKVEALVNEQLNKRVGEQLKEQLTDAVEDVKKQIPVESAEMKAAEKKAATFQSPQEFLKAVFRAKSAHGVDPRLSWLTSKGEVRSGAGIVQKALESKTAGHMEIGDDSQGGFLVPEIYRNDLQQIALENSIVRANGATVIPMTTDSVKIPYVDDTSHASTVHGGVAATWTAEAADKSATKPTFGQMELTPHKLAGITYTSDELIDDSFIPLETFIRKSFGGAWGYFEDDAFIVGTGAGQPLGIQHCGCMINNHRHTASHVYVEDLAEMYARMLPSSHSNAFWVINPTVIPELIQLGSGNAAAASGKNLVWINNAADGPPFRILGRPVLISEKMQALGTAGDIGYYDFRYYLIGDRQPITIDVSPHVAFVSDETCWRFVLRVAGQCWPQSELTLRRGGTTQSPFVQLHADTS